MTGLAFIVTVGSLYEWLMKDGDLPRSIVEADRAGFSALDLCGVVATCGQASFDQVDQIVDDLIHDNDEDPHSEAVVSRYEESVSSAMEEATKLIKRGIFVETGLSVDEWSGFADSWDLDSEMLLTIDSSTVHNATFVAKSYRPRR